MMTGVTNVSPLIRESESVGFFVSWLEFASMEITQLKRECGDCKKTHRWAEVRSDFDVTKTVNYRIIGIGRAKVRLMSGRGTVFSVSAVDIKRAW